MSDLGTELLHLDPGAEIARIGSSVRSQIARVLRRRGAVVGLSGGIDSTVVAGLLARALGPERVLGILMPERDSSPESLELGRLVARTFGIEAVLEDVTGMVEAAGCYRRRDDAIRSAVPEYGPGWRSKLVLPNVLESDRFRVYSIVVRSPEGREIRARLPPEAYHGVVAATNFKQRVRKMVEYYHADRLQYAVAGTPNRLEYDQGFFVKNGDGAADVKPIAHLYKTQVYRLAEALDVPAKIRSRRPTTDTYPLEQTQEEFYFSLPYEQFDLCLAARNRGIPADELAPAVDLTAEQVGRVYRDIDAKRAATRYQHARPLLVDPIPEVGEPQKD